MANWSTLFGTNRGVDSSTNSSLSNDILRGSIPLGGVVPVMSDTTGAYSHPGGGVIDRGLMLCDGVSVIPSGPLAGQTPPGLNNQRFVRGSAAAGVSGGNSNKNIPTTILPPHAHSVTVNNANMPHGHPASPNGTASAPHPHTQRVTANSGPIGMRDYNSDGPSNLIYQTNTATSNAPHSTPAGNIPSASGPSGSAGLHSHPTTVDNEGAGGTFNVEPNYMDTVYLIRVE